MKWIAVETRNVDVTSGLPDSPQELQSRPEMVQSRSYMKPLRWLAHLPLVILPFLAAMAVEGRGVKTTVQTQVTAALAVAGQEWAKPIAMGRDVEIRGIAPNRAAVEAARAAAAATFGVRRVNMHVGTEG
jgi:hypothetical protein